jgi:hypothetical protein
MISKSTIAPKTAKNPQVLKKRVERFLVAPKYGPEVSDVMQRLSQLGRVAVFGGALRDLALFGSTACPRDIDLVVECDDTGNLEGFLSQYHPMRNRFGGLRFRTERWSFDVWRVKDTWAAKEGLVNAQRMEDMVRTTFFDWDAVLYMQRNGQLQALPDYFDRLNSRVVDINLAENPNPLGSLIRTLRIVALGRACIGQKLMTYAWEQLRRFDDNTIIAGEWSTYRSNCLPRAHITNMRVRLEEALKEGHIAFGGLFPTQLELPQFETRS